MPVAAEREIQGPAALWRADGTVDRAAVGWSRGPVHACRLPARWGRRKRWHYWGIITPREVVSLTLADLDYAAFMGSREHLRRTLEWGPWPKPDMTLEANAKDLANHR